MSNPVIRHEASGDANGIRLVNTRAFGRPDEAAIVDALRGAAGAVSLVSVLGDRLVGHILFTPVRIEGIETTHPAVGLAPLAVLPDFQKQGIGSALIRAGLDSCRSLGYGVVVVLGHPEYYPRFGFVPASTAGLGCEFPVPSEAFMLLELQPGALGEARGIVRYAPQFSAG